jgi:hypothetical protein
MRRFVLVGIVLGALGARAGEVLDGAMHHLRFGAAREWAEFAQNAEGDSLVAKFAAKANAAEWAIRLRHRELRQPWEVRINGKSVARLPLDENEMVTYWAVPAGVLKEGENELRVVCPSGAKDSSDDVMVGEVELFERPCAEVLSEASLDVEVTEEGKGVPCRVTIVDERGALVGLGTASNEKMAVRPGVVYSADGRISVRLPAGKYTAYAGRGFEYSLDAAAVEVHAGETAKRKLAIRRVVPTPGWVSCDTHIHTLTYARTHGDATVAERMLTIAGEGIELPISTEHNLQVDYGPVAAQLGVRRWFTPVMGNEVTTEKLGHFNVFPIATAKLIDWRGRDWAAMARSIDEIAPGSVVVLNHPRDIHGGFRPFDPSRHLALTGQSFDGRQWPGNAMEVVNSGAIQTDGMRLYRDWFGLLNRGRRVTPVGASDSHDVSRYIVGQGRTYVRCDDADPAKIDVGAATKALLEGRVMVSYGLLAEITVNGSAGPGDLVKADGDIEVSVRVLAPEWIRADWVGLYANGVLVREQKIAGAEREGMKWSGKWVLPRPGHDVWLAVVARGPGVKGAYWPTAKPYQATSIEWSPYVLGSSGAVWVDGDGSGWFESAYEYASRVVEKSGGDLGHVIEGLARFDEAVAAQAMGILAGRGSATFAADARRAAAGGPAAVRRAVEDFLREWEETRPTANQRE